MSEALKLFVVKDAWLESHIPAKGRTVRIKKNKQTVTDVFANVKSTWRFEIVDPDRGVLEQKDITTGEIVDHIDGADAGHLILEVDNGALQVLHVITRPGVALNLNAIRSEYFETEALVEDIVHNFFRNMNLVYP